MSDELVALERDFEAEMRQIYNRAKNEVGYNAMRFLQIVQERRGVETARRLLPTMSDGFVALWERDRLDLTVEYLVLQPRWHELFSDDERCVARQRLRDCGMDVCVKDGE